MTEEFPKARRIDWRVNTTHIALIIMKILDRCGNW